MAQVVVEMSADEARLFRAQQKIIEQERKMASGYKDVKQQSHAAGRQAQESFGSRAVGQLRSYAAGFATVTVAVSTFRSALQLLKDDAAKAQVVMDSLVESGRGLNQITAFAPERRQQLAEQRNRLGMKYGVPLSQIENLQFMAGSLGFEPAVPEIVEAAGANVLTTEAASIAGGKISRLFERTGITPREAINAVLAGAVASEANFEQITEQLPTAAEGTNQAKMTPSETIAALSVLSSTFKGPETAAQRINRFATNIAYTPGFEGMGLVEATRSMAAMPEEQRSKILGESMQMRSAYAAIISNAELIDQRTKEVEQAIANVGTPESIFRSAISTATDPRFPETERNRLRMEQNRAQVAQDVTRLEIDAAGAAERRTAATREETRMLAAGYDPVSRLARRGMREFTAGIGMVPQVSQAIEEGLTGPGMGAAGLGAYLVRAFRGLSDSAEKLNQASDRLLDSTEANDRRAQRSGTGVAE